MHRAYYHTKRFKFLLVTITVLGFGLLNNLYAQPTAQNGFLDLSNFDFQENEFIALNGEWEFYWNELLNETELKNRNAKSYREISSLWNDDYSAIGYATYKLTILFPKNTSSLSLEIPDFYSSFEMYLDSQLIAENGKVAKSKKDYTPKWEIRTVPIQFSASDTVTLVLQVANFDHHRGGGYKHILLGKSKTLIAKRYNELAYSFILTGALLMTSFFFLGLYIFGQREKAIFYFSLFCLFYGYRVIGTSYYALHTILPDLPWVLTIHFEYFSLFLSGLFFGRYTLHLFPKETSKKLIDFLSLISILFLIITLLFPPSVFTQLVLSYAIILIAYIIYAFWTYLKATYRKRDGAIFAIGSTAIGLFVFMYEIVIYLGVYQHILFFTASGYIIFFIFQSLVLTYRFSMSMKKATLKAESASKAKSQFLSTMSHEIRTPLNAIIGLSDLLYRTPLNKVQEDYVKTVKLSGENLLSIINNILDYSKIESSSIELHEDEVDIQELVENVLDIIAPLNTKSALELIYSIDDSVPPYLITDSVKFQQVLINIINNAIKFTEEGQVFIELKLDKTHDKQYSKLLVTIKDTGIGIAPRSVKKLFESFSQVDGSTTRKYGGTGLGLAISKRLIEAMDGEVSVSSEPNKGTEFNFFIKVKRSDKKAPIYQSNILKSKKVLFLDDNEINLNIFREQALFHGLEVETTSDYRFITENLSTLNTFDFIVLDMQMPEKDGVEIARQIRSIWDKKTLPLVLLSSIHAIENKADSLLFNLQLTKPVKQSQLFRVLEQLFIAKKDTSDNATIEPPNENKKLAAKILVAEDNIFNQKVAHKVLERLGYNPVIVENGKEAFDAIFKDDYDLVFMDVEMPIMDGITTTENIRAAEHKLAKRPIIIAMTANAMNEDKLRCFNAGMDDFITKPITIDLLDKALIKWLPK